MLKMTSENRSESGGYKELMELLEPLLYAVPSVSDIIKEKYSEFNLNKKKGVAYSRDQLISTGLRSLGGLAGHIAKEAGRGGLIQKMILKNAGEYFADAILEMIVGGGK